MVIIMHIVIIIFVLKLFTILIKLKFLYHSKLMMTSINFFSYIKWKYSWSPIIQSWASIIQTIILIIIKLSKHKVKCGILFFAEFQFLESIIICIYIWSWKLVMSMATRAKIDHDPSCQSFNPLCDQLRVIKSSTSIAMGCLIYW